MKPILSFIIVLFSATMLWAAPDDTGSLYKKGREYMMKGDMENAVMLLKQAYQQEPNNVNIQKDLAYSLYLKRDYSGAIEIGKNITQQPSADDMCYQILGMSYKAIAEYKGCEKLYKEALKKYPNSGVIYNEFGDLYMQMEKPEKAIASWELGIKNDPNYSGNYYNATNYYTRSRNLIWAVIYGEIFVNIEGLTERSGSIKKQVSDDYKKLLSSPSQLQTALKSGNKFEEKFASIILNHIDEIKSGITVESLTSLRSKFILDWFVSGNTFPFRLFDQHKQLIEERMFNAYNQWLFTQPNNQEEYLEWIKNNAKENEKFEELKNNRVFKIPQNQYYK